MEQVLKKELIFVGGALTSKEQEIREKIAEQAVKIQNIIAECNFKFSSNLISDKTIWGDKLKAYHKDFKNGHSFKSAGKEAIASIPIKKIEMVRGLRAFDDKDEFNNAFMAENYILKQIKNSIAGIFEISARSPGAVAEIVLMIYHFRRPVLALSSKNFGGDFPVTLTGSPSVLLRTARYDDLTLDKIIKKFLLEELPKRKQKSTSVMLPIYLDDRINEVCQAKNMSKSKFILAAIQEFLEENNHAVETYVNHITEKVNNFFKG